MSNPRILKMLDVSTGHISEQTAKWLGTQAEVVADYQRTNGRTPFPLFHVGGTTCGWVVYVYETASADDFPEDLIRVFEFAAKHDCTYIWFDRDGKDYEELPTYDW